MYTLFANSGLQYIYTNLSVSSEYGQARNGWEQINENYLWLKYRIDAENNIILCVDTNTGTCGQVCETEQKLGKRTFPIDFSAIGVEEQIQIQIISSSSGTGDPKPASLVLDFGNSRSIGLIVEEDQNQTSHMIPSQPFELISTRLRIERAEHNDEDIQDDTKQVVFESNFVFVNDLIPTEKVQTTITKPAIYEEIQPTGLKKLLGQKPQRTMVKKPEEITQELKSGLFSNISPVRLGNEVNHLYKKKYYRTSGRPLVGLSGPKRYLWDEELDHTGRYWHQFNPDNNDMNAVSGPYFKHVKENDEDWVNVPINEDGTEYNPQPRYPRRSLITACIYEILEKAYSQINSIEYRKKTSEEFRKRQLSNLVMSYPSALSFDEHERYKIQVQKALDIFCFNHEITDDEKPTLRLEIDEGSAGQLAFVYGEIQAFKDAETWLKIVGKEIANNEYRARIATIDIGGGTSDLVISDFIDKAYGPSTDLKCEIIHVDGANKAGDDLLVAIIQKIIIPQFCSQVGLTKDQSKILFESVTDHNLKDNRITNLREIWRPAANAYISLANGQEGSFFKLEDSIESIGVLPKLMQSIKDTFPDYLQMESTSNFKVVYNKLEFKKVLEEVMHPILAAFCDTITRFDCDLVTLAGRPSDLVDIQELITQMLPLTRKRIIPMGNYRIGSWYPLQNNVKPGYIKDPKSVVVVGAAIDHLSYVTDSLGSLKVSVQKSIESPQTFFWGEVNRNQRSFRNRDAFFKAKDGFNQREAIITLVGGELIIARRLTQKEGSEPIPTYALRVKKGNPIGQLKVTLRCVRKNNNQDEVLELVDVSGNVEVDNITFPAELGIHVDLISRGMIEMEHFLDDGMFFDIAYEKISS